MDKTLHKCSVGVSLDSECHKTSFSKKTGFVKKFTEEETQLIIWRSGIDTPEFTLCYHHKETILNRYSKGQTICCDPFGDHSNSKNL